MDASLAVVATSVMLPYLGDLGAPPTPSHGDKWRKPCGRNQPRRPWKAPPEPHLKWLGRETLFLGAVHDADLDLISGHGPVS